VLIRRHTPQHLHTDRTIFKYNLLLTNGSWLFYCF